MVHPVNQNAQKGIKACLRTCESRLLENMEIISQDTTIPWVRPSQHSTLPSSA